MLVITLPLDAWYGIRRAYSHIIHKTKLVGMRLSHAAKMAKIEAVFRIKKAVLTVRTFFRV